MKFYRYPLALVSYSLIGIFLIVLAWHRLGGNAMETFWYYFPAGAAFYLVIAFVLSKLNFQWEWDTAIQVAFVLAPVLWYVNIKDPYKRPVYIFIVKEDYKGNLDVNFNLEKDAPTNARSTADTLYFTFDDDGQILLNEDATYIKESMRKRLFFLYPDTKKKRVQFADKNKLPADTTQKVLVEDSVEVEKGRLKAMHFTLNFPQHIK
jgi:hypothetical protein